MNTTIKQKSLERVRYFPRQLMTAEDMRAEQDYFLERMRRHNRLLHGWGIACGLEVKPAATADKPARVSICPGFALSPQGDEIYVAAPVLFDLASPPSADDSDCIPCPCPPGPPLGASETAPTRQFLAIRYASRSARPVRLAAASCGCGDNGCETSRERDDFALQLLTSLPVPYDKASQEAEIAWITKLKSSLNSDRGLFGVATPDCNACFGNPGPWIVLATIMANPDGSASPQIDVELRRAMLNVQSVLSLHCPIPETMDV